MARKGVDQQHSQTAIMAALYRAVSYREYPDTRLGPDHLAARFLPGHFRFFIKSGKVRANVRVKSDQMTPGGYEYVVARTAFFDACYEKAIKEGVPQIVILGAGYDTRAVRFAAQNVDTRVFELDILSTQSRKRKILEKAKIEIPEWLSLTAIDFNNDSVEAVLAKAGYKKEFKTLFLWEGVSMYLEPEAVRSVLAFFKSTGNRDNELVFDYVIPATEENMSNYYGIKAFVETWKKHRTNEGFKFSMEEDEMGPFLAEAGVVLKRQLNSQDIESEYLTLPDKELLGHINGFFRFVITGL